VPAGGSMGAIHSVFKGFFVGWAFFNVYGYYDPQWRQNFLWWFEWSFLEPNPELWERNEEYMNRFTFDRMIHHRDFINQGGESHFHKYFLGTENEGEYWGTQLPEFDEVLDQIYRVESRVQRVKHWSDKLRKISEYPLPDFTGKKELPPNRIFSKVDETWRPKHFCLANMLWETDGFVDFFEEVVEENQKFEDAIADKYKDPKLRELYWDFRRESQEHLSWDLYDLMPYLACQKEKQEVLSVFLQDDGNRPFIRTVLQQEYGAHRIFDKAGIVPYGEGASSSLLAKYDATHGPYNEALFF